MPVDRRARPAAARSTEDEWRGSPPPASTTPPTTVMVRYRTRDGRPGVDVVVPLRTPRHRPAGRPRLAGDRQHAARPHRRARSPAGEVTVTGWVRADATGDSAVVEDGSTRAISARRSARPSAARSTAGSSTSRPRTRAAHRAGARRAARPRQRPALLLRPAVVVLRAARRLRLRLPRVGRARGGVAGARLRRGRLPGRMRRPASERRSMPPSTGSMTPVTNDAAGDSRKAAARPNSSGSRSGPAGCRVGLGPRAPRRRRSARRARHPVGADPRRAAGR